jgi:L-ascorbate metabolism protein UlaG (beta-lactamase superfamily)
MSSQKKYPYYEHGYFSNNKTDQVKSNLLKTIFYYLKSFPYLLKKDNSIIPIDNNESPLIADECFTPVVIPMGHATVCILYKGITILLDPLFGDPSIFFKRHTQLSPHHKNLPCIDFLLLSHNHPDHCDQESLRYVNETSPHVACYAPLMMSGNIKPSGIDKIIECAWWQQVKIEKNGINIQFHCLPAIHWSQSGILDKNKSLWCSWMIQLDEYTIYFAGDTAYSNHFKVIQQEFPSIDCALLPIAPYEPEYLQIDSHLNPQQGFEAFIDLDASIFIPIHWGVIRYGDEDLIAPLNKTIDIMEKNKQLSQLQGIALGERVSLPSKKLFNQSIFTEKNIPKTTQDLR